MAKGRRQKKNNTEIIVPMWLCSWRRATVNSEDDADREKKKDCEGKTKLVVEALVIHCLSDLFFPPLCFSQLRPTPLHFFNRCTLKFSPLARKLSQHAGAAKIIALFRLFHTTDFTKQSISGQAWLRGGGGGIARRGEGGGGEVRKGGADAKEGGVGTTWLTTFSVKVS